MWDSHNLFQKNMHFYFFARVSDELFFVSDGKSYVSRESFCALRLRFFSEHMIICHSAASLASIVVTNWSLRSGHFVPGHVYNLADIFRDARAALCLHKSKT